MTRRAAGLTKKDHTDAISTMATSSVLALHDRLIGRLDRRARARLLRAALERGWDRTWDDGPFAA